MLRDKDGLWAMHQLQLTLLGSVQVGQAYSKSTAASVQMSFHALQHLLGNIDPALQCNALSF
jgi:hypothetical protein